MQKMLPHRVVYLLTMLEFKPEVFVNLSNMLGSLRAAYPTRPLGDVLGDGESRRGLARILENIASLCHDYGLTLSAMQAKRALEAVEGGGWDKHQEAEILNELVQRCNDELSTRFYLTLTPDEADRYSNPWDGWGSVVKRFDITSRDVEEMNKCYALGRYTASMFHALQIAEWGAIKLGDYIGVSDPKKGWGATVKKLSEIIKAGHPSLPSGLAGKFEFLEQMSREIDSIVLAWRHKVDHAANHLAIVPNSDFTPDIAAHIIDSVKVFMNRLVEGIS